MLLSDQQMWHRNLCCALGTFLGVAGEQTPVGSEAALVLWKVFFSNGEYQSIPQKPCKNFSCDRGQSNLLIIGAVRFVPFVLVQVVCPVSRWRLCGVLYATLALNVSKFLVGFYWHLLLYSLALVVSQWWANPPVLFLLDVGDSWH